MQTAFEPFGASEREKKRRVLSYDFNRPLLTNRSARGSPATHASGAARRHSPPARKACAVDASHSSRRRGCLLVREAASWIRRLTLSPPPSFLPALKRTGSSRRAAQCVRQTMSRVQVLLLIVLCSTAAAKFNTQLDATHKGELIAKINAFVATPNEKSVKIDVSNSKFGRLRDLSESCYARQPALPAGAEATSRVVFLAGTDTADKDGTSKRTTAIAIFGMTKEGGAHDRYGQLPALLDFIILSLPKELPGRGWGTETWSFLCNQR